MTILFTYGTLAIPHIMTALTEKQFRTIDAEAGNYARLLLKGKPYPGIIFREGATTFGRLYCDVDERTIQRLDEFEDEVYIRESIQVRTISGDLVEAWAYTIPRHQSDALSDCPWDENMFISRYGRTYVAMCKRLRRTSRVAGC